MTKIATISGREILDSRGMPTVESTVVLENGISARASVPSGPEPADSHAPDRAVELRDGDKGRFNGMGVRKAVEIINTVIAPKIIGMHAEQQGLVDKAMIDLDGTLNKERLGANSILSVSFAVAKSAAESRRTPLFAYLNLLMQSVIPGTQPKMPTPLFNIINGGKHGAGNLDFQEFLVVPSTAKPYNICLEIGGNVYQAVRQVLIERNATYSLGDEGGFAPNLYTNVDALEALTQAVKKTQYQVGVDVFLGLDIAASHIKTEGGYRIKDRPVALTPSEFIDYLKDLNRDYHLLILEDPFAEDAWNEWQMLTKELRQSLLIIGDDLLFSSKSLLDRAIKDQACSAILIKPNQVGTLSEVLQLVQRARSGGMQVVMSHRSGETNDDIIADLSVAVGAEYAKFGAPVRGERVAKYNRLSEIFAILSQSQKPSAGPPPTQQSQQ